MSDADILAQLGYNNSLPATEPGSLKPSDDGINVTGLDVTDKVSYQTESTTFVNMGEKIGSTSTESTLGVMPTSSTTSTLYNQQGVQTTAAYKEESNESITEVTTIGNDFTNDYAAETDESPAVTQYNYNYNEFNTEDPLNIAHMPVTWLTPQLLTSDMNAEGPST